MCSARAAPQLTVTAKFQQLQFQIRSLKHLHNRIDKNLWVAVSMRTDHQPVVSLAGLIREKIKIRLRKGTELMPLPGFSTYPELCC